MKNSISLCRKTLVKADFGIHARPASKIAQIAGAAQSSISLSNGTLRVDAADVLDILSLNAIKGTEIIIEIENQDDMEVLSLIVDFFETGFGETV